MINFEARCTSLTYGKPYGHGVIKLFWCSSFDFLTKLITSFLIRLKLFQSEGLLERLAFLCILFLFLINFLLLLDNHCGWFFRTYWFLNIPKISQKTFKHKIWLYDRGDYDKFKQYLSDVDWDSLISSNNEHFYIVLTDLII
jgi:hypothetical protein